MKKTNKTFKRFAAITSASLLAACAVMPAVSSALDFNLTDPKVEVNEDLVSTLPEGAVIQETVSAYQVFTLTKVDDLYNVTGWGTGVKSADLIKAITENATDFQIDGENDTKVNAFAGITAADDDSAQKVGAALSKLNEEQQEAFAKAVMNNLKAATATGTYANNKVSFTTIADGYYIMSCEVKKDNGASYTSESLGMLTVVDNNLAAGVIGNIGENGQAKVGLPTVQKKVYEDQAANAAEEDDLAKYETDALWNDVADYDIGDPVPFKLYGTLPADLSKYDTYYYCFNDTLDSQFDAPLAENVVVKIDGNVVSEGDNMDVNVVGNNITVSFNDIKTAATGVTNGSLVTVEYTAVLNEEAVIGNPGQVNKVNLTYSNNPNNSGIGNNDKGTTPDDYVKVHTYAVKLDKNFFNAAGKELTPAEVTEGVYDDATFSLSKGADVLYFLPSTDSDYDYVLAKEGETVTIDGKEYTATKDLKLTLVSNELVIRIKGLDEGAYTLTETNAPEGFNTAPAQTITINAGTVNDQSWNGTEADVTLESFSWTVDDGINTPTTVGQGGSTGVAIDAIAKATMENRQGTSLPGTGGIGTTIFYLGGGAMAAIGGIYLISKRRMRKSEE